MPFTLPGWATGYSRPQAPEKQWNCSRVPLMGFGSPSEDAQAPSRCPELTVSRQPDAKQKSNAPTSSASLEVSTPYSVFPARGSGMMVGPASPDRLRLQVFTTSWRLHPPRACRPYFMPDPLVGSPFRAFFLSRSRTLSSSASTLMAFERLQGLAPRESPPLDSAV
jgi:hypothetical protein